MVPKQKNIALLYKPVQHTSYLLFKQSIMNCIIDSLLVINNGGDGLLQSNWTFSSGDEWWIKLEAIGAGIYNIFNRSNHLYSLYWPTSKSKVIIVLSAFKGIIGTKLGYEVASYSKIIPVLRKWTETDIGDGRFELER